MQEAPHARERGPGSPDTEERPQDTPEPAPSWLTGRRSTAEHASLHFSCSSIEAARVPPSAFRWALGGELRAGSAGRFTGSESVP